jgi:uncharacterized protein (TIGR02421 family)
LIVEIWSAPDADVAAAARRDEAEPTELQPDFVISAHGPSAPLQTLDSLRKSLERLTVLKQPSTVRIDERGPSHPSGVGYLLSRRELAKLQCYVVGVRVRPIYRDHVTGQLYPALLRALKRGLGRAIKQTFFTFAKARTSATPDHYYAFGRRSMVAAVWEVDRRFAEVANQFDLLLSVTPVNAEAAWKRFRRRKFAEEPRFYYRPLSVDPAVLKRQLYEAPIEKIEDPTLAYLFRQRQDELDRKLTLLSDIGTKRFLLGSLQVFGEASDRTMRAAKQLLTELPARSREEGRANQLSAEQFAEFAQAEIDRYAAQYDGFRARAIVRDDIYAGLLCAGGNLLIGRSARIPRRRAEALVQHEVGVHLATYYNGLSSRLLQLHSGFAGYDALQEGLAVLAEYLVGGLSAPRLRLLAARVVAVQRMVHGASFNETFRLLDQDYGFSQRTAYTVTMRVYRGGGLTKDAVYLRGLIEVLDYFKDGGDLAPLFVGKIALEHIPLIRELLLRKVLQPPMLRPRFLDGKEVEPRLQKLRQGVALLDLVQGKNR